MLVFFIVVLLVTLLIFFAVVVQYIGGMAVYMEKKGYETPDTKTIVDCYWERSEKRDLARKFEKAYKSRRL